MKRFSAIVLGAMLAFFSAVAASQTYQNELSLFGSFDNASEPEDYESSIFHLRYGRYLNPQIVGTVGISRSHFDARNVDFTATALTVGAKYYFGLSSVRTVVPFAEAAVGWARTDTGFDDANDFTWEIGGGASYFISESTSFDGTLRWYQTDTDGGDTEGLRLFLGVTTRF